MTDLAYPETGYLTHTAKEAVAAAILHQTFDRLRGAEEEGRIIYREKPSKVLHTQMLLPRRKPSPGASSYLDKEDVTSPSHIGTAGLTFQIVNRRDRALSVAIRACIYVRVLPSQRDLLVEPVVFRLSKDARSVIMRHRRETLRRAEEENRSALGDEGKRSPAWHAIKEKATEQAQQTALAELGIAPGNLSGTVQREAVLSVLPENDREPSNDDPSVSLQEVAPLDETPEAAVTDGTEIEDGQASQGSAVGDADTLRTLEFVVSPGAPNAPPEILTEREQIPQKWVRVPVDFGALRIDLSQDSALIDHAIAAFNATMKRKIEDAINAWALDGDGEIGGLLWGFPAGSGSHSQRIAPAEVVAWEQTLAALRAIRPIARPDIEPVLEYENLEDPLHPDARTIRIILANESELIKSDYAVARETDATLYQVQLAVEFEPDLHKPIKLERIAPSYRYNRYLKHDALGINCGVRRRRLVDTHVLETTTLPIYFQPLTRQFETAPGPDFGQLSARDGGLPFLRQLLAAYDNWFAGVESAKPYELGLDPVADAEDLAQEKRQFQTEDLRSWRAESHAIWRGVEILEQAIVAARSGKTADDPEVMPLTAWRFMNQTFQEFWKRRNKGVTQWRLFQVAFILAQLPAIVSRLDFWKSDERAYQASDEREATLLYFSTGGGKSESFFGLLVFALAFDRLRGKNRGITAAIRYPLRLLTSQQAFRLSQVLAAAHRVRWAWEKREEGFKGRDFEIGFWVGGNNTPNNPSARGVSEIPKLADDWDEHSARRGDYALYLKKWSRLPACPFCNDVLPSQDGRRRSTIGLRRFSEGRDERLAHFCFNKSCTWNLEHGARARPHCPDLYESFYSRLAPPQVAGERGASGNAEHRSPTRRRYVSLMTNGRTHTAATVAVLSAFHLTISRLLKSLIEGDDATRWKVREAMAGALPDDIFQEGHRQVLLDNSVSHDQVATIIDLNRIALLYVTNKKGGDNVKAALQDVVRRDHRLAGLDEIPGVKTALITGAIDAGLIGAIVTEAASKPPVGTPFSMASVRDSLRCVIATSAISHGVDVDEFNTMFFAGMPPDIAEYIQASSRVGRTHVGTSILIPTPQQRRDRYVVEIHDIFHRFLERMIDAAPVERWAENAINRTLASFLQLKLCGVDYIRNMNAAKTAIEKAAQAEPDNVGEIGDRSRNDHVNMLGELRQFVVDGIGLYHATSPINKSFYEQRIEQLFDSATQAMEQTNWRSETLDSFFRQPASPLSKPMTSLRDVNEAGVLEGGAGTGTDRINRSDLGRVMSALMRGNNAWTAGDAGE
jgi:Helicase conserved C-terminal domain